MSLASRTRLPAALALLTLLALGGSGFSSSSAAAAAVVEDDEADKPPGAKDLVAPAPGIEKVVPMAPTWCEGVDKKDMPNGVIDSAFVPENMRGYIFADGINRFGAVPPAAAALIAWSACLRPDDKNRRQWIAAYRQAMLNTSGMTEAENREQMKLLVMSEDRRQKMLDKVCSKYTNQHSKTPEEDASRIAFMSILYCGMDKSLIGKAMTHLASVPEIKSQVSLAAFVQNCVGAQALTYGDERLPLGSSMLASYAFCARDIERLDRAKLHKELAAMSLTPIERDAAISTFALAKWYTDWLAATYKKEGTKHPWVKTLAVDAPRDGFDAWMALYKANQEAVDLARSLESKYVMNGNSKSKLKQSFAGCAPPLRKALAGYLKAKKPKTASEVRKLLADGVGHPLVAASAACEAVQGKPEIAVGYKELVFKTSLGITGPRHQAYKAAVDRVAELMADQKNFPFSVGTFNPIAGGIGGTGWAEQILTDYASDYGATSNWIADDQPGSQGSTPDGVVKSVKPKDGGVLVEFKTEKWKEPVYNCTPTNKVDRIDFVGDRAEIVYQQNCKYAGTEPRSFTLRPVWVPTEFAGGLRAGLIARTFGGTDDGKGAGLIVEAYSDAQRKDLAYSMVTGF